MSHLFYILQSGFTSGPISWVSHQSVLKNPAKINQISIFIEISQAEVDRFGHICQIKRDLRIFTFRDRGHVLQKHCNLTSQK